MNLSLYTQFQFQFRTPTIPKNAQFNNTQHLIQELNQTPKQKKNSQKNILKRKKKKKKKKKNKKKKKKQKKKKKKKKDNHSCGGGSCGKKFPTINAGLFSKKSAKSQVTISLGGKNVQFMLITPNRK
jgi:outer membrane biosynthesis protein TonB